MNLRFSVVDAKLLSQILFIISNVGTHPRFLVDGFEIGKKATLEFLEKFKTPVVMGDTPDKEILKMVARTTIRTKVNLCSCPYLSIGVVVSVVAFLLVHKVPSGIGLGLLSLESDQISIVSNNLGLRL